MGSWGRYSGGNIKNQKKKKIDLKWQYSIQMGYSLLDIPKNVLNYSHSASL